MESHHMGFQARDLQSPPALYGTTSPNGSWDRYRPCLCRINSSVLHLSATQELKFSETSVCGILQQLLNERYSCPKDKASRAGLATRISANLTRRVVSRPRRCQNLLPIVKELRILSPRNIKSGLAFRLAGPLSALGSSRLNRSTRMFATPRRHYFANSAFGSLQCTRAKKSGTASFCLTVAIQLCQVA